MRLVMGMRLLHLWLIAIFVVIVPAVPSILATLLNPDIQVTKRVGSHIAGPTAAKALGHTARLATANRPSAAQFAALHRIDDRATHEVVCEDCRNCVQCANCASFGSVLAAAVPKEHALSPHRVDGAEPLHPYADFLPPVRERPPRLV